MYIVGDAIETLLRFEDETFDGVLTSPPYNFGRNPRHRSLGAADINFYDKYADTLTEDEYIDYTVALFKVFHLKVKPRGVICWNQGASTKASALPFKVISAVMEQTEWTIADVLYWEKSNCTPFQTSPNKMSPLVEPVYIFSRKAHTHDHIANKPLGKRNEQTGQQFYKKVTNLIKASNGKSTSLNHSTFSVQFAQEVLSRYFAPGSYIVDPFVGSGTTILAAQQIGIRCVGIDISADQRDLFEGIEKKIT